MVRLLGVADNDFWELFLVSSLGFGSIVNLIWFQGGCMVLVTIVLLIVVNYVCKDLQARRRGLRVRVGVASFSPATVCLPL